MPDTGPAVVDFDLWRGSNLPPLIWGLENDDGTPFPVAGSVFVLSVRWAGGSIRKSTAEVDGFTLDEDTSELAWAPSLEESRLVPLVRDEETAVAKELSEAKAANARVSMGAIVTASQAMAAESRAQAFLRGMLNEVDKGRDHDGRH